MDIKLPVALTSLPLLNAAKGLGIDLQLHQTVAATLLDTDVLRNSIALKLGEQVLQLQANQPLSPSNAPPSGSVLILQVARLTPLPEFRLLDTRTPPATPAGATPNASPPSPANSTTPANTPNIPRVPAPAMPTNMTQPVIAQQESTPTAPNPLQFRLLPDTGKAVTQAPTSLNPNTNTNSNSALSTPSATAQPTLLSTSPPKPTADTPVTPPPAFNNGQVFSAKIIGSNAHGIQVQILSTPATPNSTASSGSRIPAPNPAQPPVITIPLTALKIPLVNTSPQPQPAQPGTPTTTQNPAQSAASVSTPNVNLASASASPRPSAPPLTIGNTLMLSVEQTADKTSFQLLHSVNSHADTQTMQSSLMQQLPKHSSALPLIQQLVQYLPALQASKDVPEALQRIALKIWQTLPTSQQLSTPLPLKQSLTNSGLLLEAKLAETLINTSNAPTEIPNTLNDLKATLLQLHQALQHTAPSMPSAGAEPETSKFTTEIASDLQQKTEHALAKVTVDQLASITRDDSSKQVWHIEIPYRHQEQLEKLELSVSWEEAPNSTEAYHPFNWTVLLNISPPGLGPIHCKIICSGGAVNTYFRSERGSTRDKIQEYAELLRTRLEANGLQAGHIDSQEGSFQQPLQTKIKLPNLFYGKA